MALVDKSPIMNVYKFYNLPILHPVFQNFFWYSVEGEYIALSSDGDYVTLLSEWDMLTCVFTRGHTCQFDTAEDPTKKVSWCLYTLFVNDAEWIEINCKCEEKLQTNIVAYNINRNLWTKRYWEITSTMFKENLPNGWKLPLPHAYLAYNFNHSPRNSHNRC